MLYRRLIEENLDDRRIVLSDGQTGMTFQQIHKRTAQYCAVFQEMGLKKGARIVTETDNPIHTVFVLLACIAKGLIFVPLNRNLDEAYRQKIIEDCNPSLILEQLPPNILKEKQISVYFNTENRKLYPEDTLVYIIYTSGSEGIPRGVVASQKQIFFCCKGINQRLGNTAADRILCCLPLSFDYGLYQIFLAFFSKATLYLDNGDVIQRIPYLLEKWEITGFPTIPSIANILVRLNMLKGEYNQLRYITFTGEILSVPLIEKLERICPRARIIPMYGLTECKRIAVMPENREDKIKAGSCGTPLDGVQVFLEKKEVDSGIGELVIAGENIMEGYWGIPDTSTDTYFTDKRTGKRLLRTGDLFKIDEEGFLYFCGRKSRIIKIWGHRISNVWIESKLNAVKGVIESAVTSIPDKEAGEKLIIFIYSNETKIEKEIQAQMAEFPIYLQEYDLFILKKPLPKNPNGKTDIKKLLKKVNKGEILRK